MTNTVKPRSQNFSYDVQASTIVQNINVILIHIPVSLSLTTVHHLSNQQHFLYSFTDFPNPPQYLWHAVNVEVLSFRSSQYQLQLLKTS